MRAKVFSRQGGVKAYVDDSGLYFLEAPLALQVLGGSYMSTEGAYNGLTHAPAHVQRLGRQPTAPARSPGIGMRPPAERGPLQFHCSSAQIAAHDARLRSAGRTNRRRANDFDAMNALALVPEAQCHFPAALAA